tara:strand:+ start:6709 stop:7014 length:306 start_codon:yes stop_codon:yes gene_type:complete
MTLLKKILGTVIIAASLSLVPYSSAYSQMTGSTTYGSKQDPNLRDRIPKDNSRAKKWGRKALDKLTGPYSPLIKGAEIFSKKYEKFRNKTGNRTGTGRTTE